MQKKWSFDHVSERELKKLAGKLQLNIRDIIYVKTSNEQYIKNIRKSRKKRTNIKKQKSEPKHWFLEMDWSTAHFVPRSDDDTHLNATPN